MFTRMICWLLLVLCPTLSHADELTAQKTNDIRKLIVSTGGTKIGVQFAGAVTQNLSTTLRKARPDIPERFFTVLHKELVTLFEERMNAPGGMVERVTPIYAKHFTHPEIKELLAFYQTSIGQKAIDVLPRVVAESMVAGQAWGESLAPEINRRVAATLKREGIELPRK